MERTELVTATDRDLPRLVETSCDKVFTLSLKEVRQRYFNTGNARTVRIDIVLAAISTL